MARTLITAIFLTLFGQIIWPANASSGFQYECGVWTRTNKDIKIPSESRAAFPDQMGKPFTLKELRWALELKDKLGRAITIEKVGRHNGKFNIYRTAKTDEYGNTQIFFVAKHQMNLEILAIHPNAKYEYKLACQK